MVSEHKKQKSLFVISQRINIKPLSVNEAWQGKRFKTKKYKQYEKQLLTLLRRSSALDDLKKHEKLKLEINLGFSSANSDYDNPIKLIQDILQKKYVFNDSKIYEARIKKNIVNKGHEYFDFTITKLDY